MFNKFLEDVIDWIHEDKKTLESYAKGKPEKAPLHDEIQSELLYESNMDTIISGMQYCIRVFPDDMEEFKKGNSPFTEDNIPKEIVKIKDSYLFCFNDKKDFDKFKRKYKLQ